MAYDFPSSPTNGQTYTAGNKNYTFNGAGWELSSEVLNTDNITEGSVNLYYTDARAYSNSQLAGYITTADLDGYATNNQIADFIVSTSNIGSITFETNQIAHFNSGTRDTKTVISASDIDLSQGNFFTKTITGNTTFTVSNVASSGNVSAFLLELTNGGSQTVNWFNNVTWNGGTPPTLTASGVDVLSFFTHTAGSTWRGFVLGQAMA